LICFSHGPTVLFFVYVQFTAGRWLGVENNPSVMSIETGGAHPLAAEPDIQLDTDLSVNLLDLRAYVIGDHIVVALVDLRIHNPEGDVIILWIGSGSG
jgi:hypothetical protein